MSPVLDGRRQCGRGDIRGVVITAFSSSQPHRDLGQLRARGRFNEKSGKKRKEKSGVRGWLGLGEGSVSRPASVCPSVPTACEIPYPPHEPLPPQDPSPWSLETPEETEGPRSPRQGQDRLHPGCPSHGLCPPGHLPSQTRSPGSADSQPPSAVAPLSLSFFVCKMGASAAGCGLCFCATRGMGEQVPSLTLDRPQDREL